MRSPHGVGKTALAAQTVLWFALTRDEEDWKIPTTASAWRQLSKFLWPEIHKWARKLIWSKIGRSSFSSITELLTLNLRLQTGESFAVASDVPELIEGAHADKLLYVFDEAKVIPEKTWDAAEGAFSGAGKETKVEAFALAISTPGEPLGRFYDIQTRKPGYEDWWVRHVRKEEAIQQKRISQEWVEQRKLQWGEKSSIYINRVEGEFASADEDGVIPLAWVEKAVFRYQELLDSNQFVNIKYDNIGVDVARMGADKTVMALKIKGKFWIHELRKTVKEDTMQTTGRVSALLRKHKCQANIDVIGIGAGVYDRLKELKFKVFAFNAAEKSRAKDQSKEFEFVNKRAEGWWKLRELLDPSNNNDVALPDDDKLIGDLVSPKWTVQSGGKIKIESKDDIKKRIERSTDDGDAVVMAFYERRKPNVIV